MANSMTGFGRAQKALHGREIAAEVKSVNSRYFEYSSRLPRSMGFVDEALKKAVAARIGRGKVDLHIGVQTPEGGEVAVTANLPAARGYYEALNRVANDLHIENDLKASHLARFPEVFNLRREETDEEELTQDILQTLQDALARCNEMRAAEGEKLAADVARRLDALEGMLGAVERDSEGRVRRHTARLAERLREVLGDTAIDEGRMLAEAALFADKTAVAEETVRLHSHLTQYREILAAGGAVGRKLDFLTQELNREVNTIGSKCQEVEITRLVVEMKAEIEKIREQIQNLE